MRRTGITGYEAHNLIIEELLSSCSNKVRLSTLTPSLKARQPSEGQSFVKFQSIFCSPTYDMEKL